MGGKEEEKEGRHTERHPQSSRDHCRRGHKSLRAGRREQSNKMLPSSYGMARKHKHTVASDIYTRLAVNSHHRWKRHPWGLSFLVS